jgi:hypothetical protein
VSAVQQMAEQHAERGEREQAYQDQRHHLEP